MIPNSAHTRPCPAILGPLLLTRPRCVLHCRADLARDISQNGDRHEPQPDQKVQSVPAGFHQYLEQRRQEQRVARRRASSVLRRNQSWWRTGPVLVARLKPALSVAWAQYNFKPGIHALGRYRELGLHIPKCEVCPACPARSRASSLLEVVMHRMNPAGNLSRNSVAAGTSGRLLVLRWQSSTQRLGLTADLSISTWPPATRD